MLLNAPPDFLAGWDAIVDATVAEAHDPAALSRAAALLAVTVLADTDPLGAGPVEQAEVFRAASWLVADCRQDLDAHDCALLDRLGPAMWLAAHR